MSTSAAEHLPPAFPARAPWGTAGKLRAWQRAALDDYLARAPRDYLAVATPGAGKTTFALRVASELLSRRQIMQVTVVAPTEHLKRQWAEAGERVGIAIDPAFSGRRGRTSRDYAGVAVTYAGVAAHPMLHRARWVRPVIFLAYGGEMQWRTRAGEEVSARLGEPLTKDLNAQAWRTALDPAGEWIPSVLRAADTRLTEIRRHVPDAGGLVIAGDQDTARAYAKLLRGISGDPATVVLSDDPGASKRIGAFAESDRRWMVAVRMVSEGVDVPRLSVGVYATSTSTPLFFAQAVGRFLRVRHRGETASVFLPSVPLLLGHAGDLEVERDHALGRATSGDEDLAALEESLVAAANRPEPSDDGPEQSAFEALGSAATFDRVLYDGGEFGTEAAVGSAEEADYLGIPGLLEPHQVTALLQRRQADQLAAQPPARRTREGSAPTTFDEIAMLRRELNALVGAWHHRTGRSHGSIHAELRRACGGAPAAHASSDELRQRIDAIRAWALQRNR